MLLTEIEVDHGDEKRAMNMNIPEEMQVFRVSRMMFFLQVIVKLKFGYCGNQAPISIIKSHYANKVKESSLFINP